MKARTGLGLLVVVSLLLSAACSSASKPAATGTDEGSAGGSSNAPTASSKSGGTDGKTYDVNFMNFAYTIFPPATGPAIDAIKAKYNVNVHSQFIANADFKNKLSVVMASGDMPDVVEIDYADQNYHKWAGQGAFLPLDQYINQYPTFKEVPDSIYNQFKVNGHIYSIPTYSPTYTFSGLIRQDWLDNLGLKMPTNYQELLNVAIAFTKNDPDKNGKNDTYGFALGQDISPNYMMGAWWSDAWYHKSQDGNYIPGIIGPGRKEIIQTLHDAYAQGGVTKDFAVLNWAQVNKEFYSGKAGIFIGTPSGMVEDYYLGLLKVDPKAKLSPIPFFTSPDGRQGGQKGPGYFGLATLSSKLKDDPGKVKKILQIMDDGRTFIPYAQRNPQNQQFDWEFGGVGKGYEMKNGIPVLLPKSEGITPIQYMMQRNEFWKPWAPSNAANEYDKTYNSPEMQALIKSIEDMEIQYNKQPYDDPSLGVYSETNATKGTDLAKFINGEETKMISGQRPISDWEKMVQEWKDRGGAQWIKEVNDGIKAKGK
ncbi:extracellular solute-binding protein [Paenibacillus filicis]|uniref:Extracellular solute-binding protein n=1 Tax=Paenibacillus gyeongsangnamensis TaxID=3388067 RepID=A0ABT4Q243_9BACL|nr:extracellular solute-binding protein [Paenibacillus filicis]MCZ8510876.1 extracellular solute-binding protein [Paenibacillus filicis]